MSKRAKIPHKTEVKLLMMNKHQCCICRNLKSSSDVEIHHINGNSSDNRLENLSVLCSYHHKLAHGALGNSKKLLAEEIKINKNFWEKRVLEEIKIKKKSVSIQERKQLEILYKFEISKRKNEILSLPQKQQQLRRAHYEFLQQLLIEEFISGLKLRPIILKAFSDIGIQSAGDSDVSLPLIDAIGGLFLHLVGPEDVKIYPDDKRLLLKSLDILETIGGYGASISEDVKVLKKTCQKIYELAEISSWYKFKEFKDKALKILKKIRRECFELGTSKKAKKSISERLSGIDETIEEVSKLKY